MQHAGTLIPLETPRHAVAAWSEKKAGGTATRNDLDLTAVRRDLIRPILGATG